MNVVARFGWNARSELAHTFLYEGELAGLAIHWSDGPGAEDHADCAEIVRGIQNFHMDTRRWNDIAYNHLVCRHGYVFEGRGYGIRSAAQGSAEGNSRYHAICYIGNGSTPFTSEGKRALQELVLDYQRRYPRAVLVRPHSDFSPTTCPGNIIRAWIGGREWKRPTVTKFDVVADKRIVLVGQKRENVLRRLPGLLKRFQKVVIRKA